MLDITQGDILVKVLFMSADPYLRSRIKSTGSYVPGKPMVGFITGKVVESKNQAWPVGSLIGASLPFSTVQVVTTEQLAATLAWDLTPYLTEDQLSIGISVLGMPGATAYGGLKDVLQPEKGQTLFVSSAAGMVSPSAIRCVSLLDGRPYQRSTADIVLLYQLHSTMYRPIYYMYACGSRPTFPAQGLPGTAPVSTM